MPTHASDPELIDPFDELDGALRIKNMDARAKSGKRKRNAAMPALAAVDEETFHYTYKAGPLESGWLYSSLGEFREARWIDDILRPIKGGKEASVYLCAGNETSGEGWLAAKVYRPRKFRALKNDVLYREGRADLDSSGRQIVDDGMLHAIHKKTDFGRTLLHESWLAYELTTLRTLHAAGCDVPRPFASSENAILMQYFGDAVMGAPTLIDVGLDRKEVRPLFERVMRNISLMLQNGIIHGDLSAFNILYWEGAITLIDFPQAVRPQINRSAYRIFERDVVRVCEYFAAQGWAADGHALAARLWAEASLSTQPQIDPRLIDEEQGDRALWDLMRNK